MSAKTPEICKARDGALRSLRDAHRSEYGRLFAEARAAEHADVNDPKATQNAIWRARHVALRGLRDRYRSEYDELYRALMGYTQRPCRVCGVPVWGGKRSSCGDPFCVDARNVLGLLIDPVQYRKHALDLARRMLAAPDSRADRVRHARRLLAGKVAPGASRWLTANSHVHEVALECAKRDLPVVVEFPQEIRDQLAAELRGAD